MKKCKQGYYYCYDDKKCKKIPNGYRVGLGGWLRKEKEEEKSEDNGETESKKNGNGNGGNADGGAVSEGWSEKYKKSIDCKNPKGFSQRAHCQGKKKVNEAKEKGDHEVSMAQTQLKKSEENIKKLRKALGTKEKDIPAWVQAKITNTEHDTDAASSYMDEGKRDGKSAKDKGYSLRDWFKGGGWVQAGGKYDGKPCAKQPGQKTKPFCRDADDRASMSKKERNRRAAKKRREDPNPNRKGKAKMVTDSYSNWRQELAEVYNKPDAQYKDLKGRNTDTSPTGGQRPPKPLDPRNKPGIDSLTGLKLAHYQPEGELVKEEGKKDACYHKVKSRYSVWPSAYASGALVKCRKVGAKNWGNKTKKEGYEFSNWRDDFQPTEFETTDLITPDPIQVPPSNLQKIEEAKKCWKGYKKVGTQKLFGKTYNRCEKIKKEEFSSWRDEISEVHRPPAGWKPYGGREKGPVPEVDATAKRIDAIRKSIKTVKEDWQKANRKDGVDGMSQSSVDAYKRENPGSKLKTAVTGKVKKGSKDAKRRKSFCARSDGQRKMHNIDCSKTPDKKICKARKRWKC